MQFNYAIWAAVFPELALWTAAPVAQNYWYEASLLLDNTAMSPVQDLGIRAMLLGLLTAHICALRQPMNGQPSSPLVGRISHAVEGTVQVQTQMEYPPGSAQYYQQTKYGSQYWQSTAQYRTARYFPGPRRNMNPYGIPGVYGSFR